MAEFATKFIVSDMERLPLFVSDLHAHPLKFAVDLPQRPTTTRGTYEAVPH
jgi:hypothetical protein